ncbi:MAG: AAA family ATPase [Deltaproteobacteria bacterium]|nr:AAA family ATPase [Deltaproteobacteria bacterium]
MVIRERQAQLSEKLNVTPEFELALRLAKKRAPFLLVTGRAGTGKTTFVHWLRSQLDASIAIVAPTGLAALTAGGQTIHSFFGFPPRFIELDEIQPRRSRAVYAKLDILIIDEISMVRADMMDAIARFLELNGPSEGAPFGGVAIIGVGDLHQLPPVVTSREERHFLEAHYASPYFHHAKALAEVEPSVVELTRGFRQEDERFLELLRRIREDDDSAAAVAELNRRCLDEHFEDAAWPVLVPTRSAAQQINDRRLDALPGEAVEWVGRFEGDFLGGTRPASQLSEDELERRLPSPYRLRLKPGTRVIFTQNDVGRLWVNGTMGTVREVSKESLRVEVETRSGGHLSPQVKPASWPRYKYAYDADKKKLKREEVGSYTQLPLAPAWSITIHKAQGQTLERVVVDLDRGAFTEGQTYVALSRCPSLDGLRIKRPLRGEDVMCDERIKRLYRRISQITANRVLDGEGGSKGGEE